MRTDIKCRVCKAMAYERISPAAVGGGAYYCANCGDAKPLNAFDADKAPLQQDAATPTHICRYREALQYLLDPEGFGLLTDVEVGAYIRKVLDEAVGN